MSLTAMDALSSSIFISRISYGNMNNPVVQLLEFAARSNNNRIGTLTINQSFNLSLWVSSSQRIGASGSRVLATSKDVSGEGIENLGSDNGHSSVFEDIISVGEFLEDSGLYESKDEAIKRQEVLSKLGEIVKLWVKNVSRGKGYTDQVVEESNAEILLDETFVLPVDVPVTVMLPVPSVAPASIPVGRQVTDELEFKIMRRQILKRFTQGGRNCQN